MNPSGERQMAHWAGKHLAVSAMFVAVGVACLWSAVKESEQGLAGPVLWQLSTAFAHFAAALAPQRLFEAIGWKPTLRRPASGLAFALVVASTVCLAAALLHGLLGR